MEKEVNTTKWCRSHAVRRPTLLRAVRGAKPAARILFCRGLYVELSPMSARVRAGGAERKFQVLYLGWLISRDFYLYLPKINEGEW